MSKVLAYLGTGAAVALVALLTLGAPAKTTDIEDIVAASVQIGKYCSGTVIQDPDLSDGEQTTILTAKHCLDTDQGVGSIIEVNIPQSLMNEYTGDTTMKTIVKDVSPVSDIITLQAIKQGEGSDLPKISIYKGIPHYGDPVVVVGYPLGGMKTVNTGVLDYIFDLKIASQTPDCVFASASCLYQQVTTQVDGGNSGGGVFYKTDSGYQLVGVLTGKDNRSNQLAYYTPLEEITTFLSGLTK